MLRAALVLLGAYVCLLGAVLHRQLLGIGGIDWPWGLLVVVALTCLVTVAAGRLTTSGGAWIAVGWAAALLGLQWSPGGSYLVASDWLGTSFMLGGLGGIVLCVALRPRLRQ